MLQTDPLSSEVQLATSHAKQKLHHDGMDSLIYGLNWLLLAVAVRTLAGSASPKMLFLTFGGAFLIDLLVLDQFAEFFRREFTDPRIGCVAVAGEPAWPAALPRSLKLVAVSANVAEGIGLLVLFFSVWWGVLLACFDPALTHSIKFDSKRWLRHFLIFAASIFFALHPSGLTFLVFVPAVLAVVCLADGTITLFTFLRAHRKLLQIPS